jgi:hypothetical protein
MSATKNRLPVMHEFRDRVLSISDAFLKLRRDKRNRFGFVEP